MGYVSALHVARTADRRWHVHLHLFLRLRPGVDADEIFSGWRNVENEIIRIKTVGGHGVGLLAYMLTDSADDEQDWLPFGGNAGGHFIDTVADDSVARALLFATQLRGVRRFSSGGAFRGCFELQKQAVPVSDVRGQGREWTTRQTQFEWQPARVGYWSTGSRVIASVGRARPTPAVGVGGYVSLRTVFYAVPSLRVGGGAGVAAPLTVQDIGIKRSSPPAVLLEGYRPLSLPGVTAQSVADRARFLQEFEDDCYVPDVVHPDDWMRVKIRRYAAKRWQDFCRRVPKISYQARVVGDLSRFSVRPQPLVAEASAAVVLVQLPFAAPQVPRRLIPHPVVYGQPGVMLVPSLVGGIRVDAAGWRYRPLQLSTTSEKIRVYRRLMGGDLSGFSATLARLMHERVAQRREVLRRATYDVEVAAARWVGVSGAGYGIITVPLPSLPAGGAVSPMRIAQFAEPTTGTKPQAHMPSMWAFFCLRDAKALNAAAVRYVQGQPSPWHG
ncbi:hypothetical protein [Vandammella animalimorsus]|uniref:hypothetical protein n=1 Tax=Vandammella animalimorsus TaxID=2029117 RepID=UPI001EEE61AB|nr:hypothetical protein [Vandammella animalimorsus]